MAAHCDVRQHESLSELARGASSIVNLAAEHRDDVRPLSRYHETNVQGASQVCLAARNAGIQKIVFTSWVPMRARGVPRWTRSRVGAKDDWMNRCEKAAIRNRGSNSAWLPTID